MVFKRRHRVVEVSSITYDVHVYIVATSNLEDAKTIAPSQSFVAWAESVVEKKEEKRRL